MTDTRLTDSQRKDAATYAAKKADEEVGINADFDEEWDPSYMQHYGDYIEALVRKDMRDWKKVITVPCSCHEDVEKVRKEMREQCAANYPRCGLCGEYHDSRKFCPPPQLERCLDCEDLTLREDWDSSTPACRCEGSCVECHNSQPVCLSDARRIEALVRKDERERCIQLCINEAGVSRIASALGGMSERAIRDCRLREDAANAIKREIEKRGDGESDDGK